MSALLNTLPGDIPGLLRRGSPVRTLRHPDARSVVITLAKHSARVGFPWSINDEDADALWLDRMVLDLTDPTGRAHAAWWAYAMCKQYSHLTISYGEDAICMTALLGDDMTPTQIDTLARLVLRLAGRTP